SSKRDSGKWLLARFSFGSVFRRKGAKRQLNLRLIQAVLRQIGSDVFYESCYPLILQRVDQAPNRTWIRWRIVSRNECPISIFARENGFAFAWSVDGNPIENVRIDPNQMRIPQIGRLCVKYFFDLFRQGVNRPARSESHIYLVLF